MTFPHDNTSDTATTLPSDSEAHPAGGYPTHTADGKPVIGHDNGTSRPSVHNQGSAPIDADPPQSPGAAETMQEFVGKGITPMLALPAGMRFETVAALSTIGQRRMEQDEAWGGPDNDHKHGRETWVGILQQQIDKLNALDPTDFEGVIDRFLDIAAVGAAAVEGLQHHLDQLDNQVTRTLATNGGDSTGGDSTGLANVDAQLAGAEPPYQAEA